MEVRATLEEKISKNGNPYTAVVIHLTDTCKKTVFLEAAEIELLKMKKDTNNEVDKEFWK